MADSSGQSNSNFLSDEIRKKVADLVDRNNRTYKDPVDAAKRSLIEACEIGFGDAQPAKDCLTRFLNPNCDDWEFDLGDLFADDKTVRERVYSETIRRTVKLPTDRERRVPGTGVLSPKELERRTATFQPVSDPIITIFQGNYSHTGWWGALGAFGLKLEVVQSNVKTARVAVRLSGSDTYKWAPKEDRVTQELHRLGDFLIKKGEARAFKQTAKQRTYIVCVDDRTLRSLSSDDTIATLGEDTSEQVNPRLLNTMERTAGQAWRYLTH